jgi:hypothetical protein
MNKLKKSFNIRVFIPLLFVQFGYAQSPEFEWVRGFGGDGGDFVNSIAVDNNGNSFITGSFEGLKVTFGDKELTGSITGENFFIAKLNPQGNVIWAKGGGGNGSDIGKSISVDDQGNCYVIGDYDNNFIIGDTTLSSRGMFYSDVFIAKYNTDGDFIWARSVGGSAIDKGQTISVDKIGNVYVFGSFEVVAYFDNPSLTITGTTVDADVFIAKLDANGTFLWARNAGGERAEFAGGMAVDKDGNVVITGGYTRNPIFGSFSFSNNELFVEGVFISKLNSSGDFLWVKLVSGSSRGQDVAVNNMGEVLVTGRFFDFITFDNTVLPRFGKDDIFISKLNSSGDFLWVRSAGGTGDDESFGIDVDNNGNFYLTGLYGNNLNFNTNVLNGSGMFLAKLDTDGNFLWAKKAGAPQKIYGADVKVLNEGIYVVGIYAGGEANFDTKTITTTFGVRTDGFITKLGSALASHTYIQQSALRIYPNPASNLLHLDHDQVINEVIVRDMNGGEVTNVALCHYKYEMDISKICRGIYIMEIKSNGVIERQKIVIR